MRGTRKAYSGILQCRSGKKAKRAARAVSAAVFSLLLLLFLTSCGRGKGGTDSSAEADQKAAEAKELLQETSLVAAPVNDGRVHIGILAFQGHGAAEETIKGFKNEMGQLMGSGRVDFEYVDADGDALKCAQAATEFENNGYSLIFACGTEAVQNAAAAVKNLPIIGGCVTDYLLSGTVSSLDAPGGNISGVCSLGPVEQQIEQAVRISAYPAKIGIISSGVETGSRFQEGVARLCIEERGDGSSWESYHGATPEELRKAVEAACRECSCLYLPTDNFVASHMEIVRDAVLASKVPAVAGDYQMCSKGALCCVSIDYEAHGRKAADMAHAVLAQGEEISRLSIREENEWAEYYNPVIAQKLEWYGYENMSALNVTEEDYWPSGEDAASGVSASSTAEP